LLYNYKIIYNKYGTQHARVQPMYIRNLTCYDTSLYKLFNLCLSKCESREVDYIIKILILHNFHSPCNFTLYSASN